MTCLMFPLAEFSWQPDPAATTPFASVRAPAPCTRMNVASAAAATAARTTRLVNFPSLCSLPLSGRQPRHRRRRYGRRGGDAEVTKWELEPARLGCTEHAARFGLDEAHPVDHQLEGRLGCAPGLVRSDREEPLELPLVCSQPDEALSD